MRAWNVAGALIEGPQGLLLVRNRRKSGEMDWSTPGGVIDATDASLLDGLAREVAEETGLRVDSWSRHVYSVVAEAPTLGWTLRCEVHLAERYSGELVLGDPDGIVVEAAFVNPERCARLLATAPQWVGEPLHAWIDNPWTTHVPREFRYTVVGERDKRVSVTRVDP